MYCHALDREKRGSILFWAGGGRKMPDHEEQIDLGPCCFCGKEGPTVRNLLMLHRKAPVAGTGWGCLVCGLPSDGAVSVLCDDCIENGKEPRFAIADYAPRKLRVPIEQLTEIFDHHRDKHDDFEFLQQPAVGEA
jgi:hypothetical protein